MSIGSPLDRRWAVGCAMGRGMRDGPWDARWAVGCAMGRGMRDGSRALVPSKVICHELRKRLNETLEKDFGGRKLAFVTDNLLLALKSMDEHLAFLVDSNPTDLAHKELLQRRILAVVTRCVIEGVAE